jgi:hypothetical protein
MDEKGGACLSPAKQIYSLSSFKYQSALFIKNETRFVKSSQVYLLS